MRLVSRAASELIRLRRKFAGAIATAAAGGNAILGKGTRIGHEGTVVNIQRKPSVIAIGENGMVRGEVLVFAHAGRIRIGDWFYLGPFSTIWSSDPDGIEIGDRVLVSYNVHIHDTDSHPLPAGQRFEHTRLMLTQGHPIENPGIRSAPVRIGNDVWIGLGATIMRGVTIGDRAIIGAHAVVRSDVPPDSFVPGPSSLPRQGPQSPESGHHVASDTNGGEQL
jgi:acetyltransferase-like isoleucine patch superfamily enzyme